MTFNKYAHLIAIILRKAVPYHQKFSRVPKERRVFQLAFNYNSPVANENGKHI